MKYCSIQMSFKFFSSHLNNKSELVQVMACIYKAYVDIYETNIYGC